jgi:DNA-binding XRE family transcriptional regulator
MKIRPRGRPRGQRGGPCTATSSSATDPARIGGELNLTPARVATILKRYGVARRPVGADLFRHGMTSRDRKQLAARLQSLRRGAGLNQDQLAARTGLSQVTISALENGRQNPTRRTMIALAERLGVRLRALLAGR